MPDKQNNIHVKDCCVIHGCVHGDPDCVVVQEVEPQSKLCDACVETLRKADDSVTNLRRIAELKPVIRAAYNTNVY